MIQKEVTVINKSGLHARPASQFIKIATGFKSDIFVKKDEEKYNAKSMFSILKACITNGTDIVIEASGEDEKEAVCALVSAIESGLGE